MPFHSVHEAASYDKWFREQVQRGLGDPRPRIANEQVKADFAVRAVMRDRRASHLLRRAMK